MSTFTPARSLMAAQRDLLERFRPSPAQMETALTCARLLADQDGGAVVPLVMPGKDWAVWTVGQPIEQPDVAFPFNHGDGSYSEARELARQLAQHVLGDRRGTFGYAVVNRDGSAATFEA